MKQGKLPTGHMEGLSVDDQMKISQTTIECHLRKNTNKNACTIKKVKREKDTRTDSEDDWSYWVLGQDIVETDSCTKSKKAQQRFFGWFEGNVDYLRFPKFLHVKIRLKRKSQTQRTT